MSPPPQRIAGICDYLSSHRSLQELPNVEDMGEAGDDKLRDCDYAAKVAQPFRGYLHLTLRTETIWAADGKSVAEALDEARDKLAIKSTAPKVDPCVYGAECRLVEPDCANTSTGSPDGPPGGRGHLAKGLAYPYQIEIVVGLWPYDTKDLCEADNWSEKLAVRLLRDTLNYLLAKTSK